MRWVNTCRQYREKAGKIPSFLYGKLFANIISDILILKGKEAF